MAKLAIGFGIALIVVGIAGFVPNHAPTALIPAYLGIVIAISGGIALNPEYRMHAMHLAVLFACLGFLAAGIRLVVSLKKPVVDNVAVGSQGMTTVLCGVFVALCVRSFIAVRRQRKGE